MWYLLMLETKSVANLGGRDPLFVRSTLWKGTYGWNPFVSLVRTLKKKNGCINWLLRALGQVAIISCEPNKTSKNNENKGKWCYLCLYVISLVHLIQQMFHFIFLSETLYWYNLYTNIYIIMYKIFNQNPRGWYGCI